MQMRRWHRYVAVFAVIVGLYFGFTGTAVQLMDLRALAAGAPADDPTMQAMRVGQSGPPNFQVIADTDYAAQPLPDTFSFGQALRATLSGARRTIGNGPLAFVEWRMEQGRPIGVVASAGKVYRFDRAGTALGDPSPLVVPPLNTPSLRNTVKDFHRLRAFGEWPMVFGVIAGLVLLTMIVTGVLLYWQLFRARARLKRSNPFWSAGGGWRTLHRAIGAIAALFLTVVALSGIVLTLSSIGVNVSKAMHGGKRPGLTADASSPLRNSELARMLATTLAAYRDAQPGRPVKVLRLRYFGGMPQGVVVAGGPETRQLAFNARTGGSASFTEPGYPDVDMPFGWQAGQIAKNIHRGDIIGMPGRWMDLLTGLSLLYLSISGVVLYARLWRARRKIGRSGVFWA